MNDALFESIIQTQAVKRGTYTLSSGKTSSYYIDMKKTLCNPGILMMVTESVVAVTSSMDIDAIGGLEFGAVPIAVGCSLRSLNAERTISWFVVRKHTKLHGTQDHIEGILRSGSRVVIVDDVVTTGASIVRAVDAVSAIGCKVVLVIAVVDRLEGASEILQSLQIPYKPLLTVNDVRLSEIIT